MTEKMESKSHSLLFHIFISLSSLLFLSSFSYVEATCKPRSFTYPISTSQHSIINPISTPSSSPPPPPTPTQSPPPPTPTQSPPTPTQSPPTPTQTKPAESISLFSAATTKPILPVIPTVSSVVAVAGDAIKNICAKTDNADLCVSTIAPFLVPGKTDPVSIFGMQLKAVNEHTQNALATATKIFQNPSNPKAMSSCIEDCKDNYEDAIDNLNAAADAMTKKDFGTVDIMLSAAMNDFGTCEDGFSEMPGLVSPMTAVDALLHKLTSNLLALSSVCKSP